MIRFQEYEPFNLDAYFGENAVTFSSYQAGIQACLELLGSTKNPIPVIMSVCSSPQLIAGVLRAGAVPVLLDVDPETFQIAPDALRMVTETDSSGVLLLELEDLSTNIGSLVRILEESEGTWLPIYAWREIPPKTVRPGVGFTIFDLGPALGEGCVVYQQNEVHILELQLVRGGLLGMSTYPFPFLAKDIVQKVAHYRNTEMERQLVKEQYIEQLTAKGLCDLIVPRHSETTYFPVKVTPGDVVIDGLSKKNIEAVQCMLPLVQLPEIAERYKDGPPEYPGADEIFNKYVLLPCVATMTQKDVTYVVNTLAEVLDEYYSSTSSSDASQGSAR